MKYKKGDRVRVIKANHLWSYWTPDMDKLVGKVCIIYDEYTLGRTKVSTIFIKGGRYGVRGGEEHGFPDNCLELEFKPGEQLEFAFMTEEPDEV